MENKKTFGAYILKRRRELGMTQRELAERLYVTELAVSKWERGLSYPDITLLQNICSVLQVSEHELLSGSEDTSRRVSEKLADKYLRLTRNYRIAQYIIYGLILLGCAAGNLAEQHTLDWFFIVAAGVMMAASLTLVPSLAAMHVKLENYKAPLAFLGFTVSLELLLLVCCLYSGGDWFPVAAVSVLFGLSLTVLPFLLPLMPLPVWMAERKTSVYLITTTVCLMLLLLLLLVCCISDGENWFLMAAVSVLFVTGLFFLPVILRQSLRTPPLDRQKALVYLTSESVLLIFLLLVEAAYGGDLRSLTVSLPSALMCLLLPWGILGAARYLPANLWFRLSACSAWTGLWIWTAPFLFDRIMSAYFGDSDSLYSLAIPFDFSEWDTEHTAFNVIMLILIGLGVLASVFACIGAVERKNEQVMDK